MDLSTRDLRAFLMLAEQLNFSRAADRFCLSQSAFSTLIRQLEQQVGVRLFDRDSRNVRLTAEGEVFRQSARRLVGDFEEALAELDDRAARRTGRVAVAALPSLAAGWLPTVFARFHGRHPGIALELFDTLSETCLAMVRSGQADFALAAGGQADAQLQTQVLCADRFHLVCRADHPLAAMRSVRLKDLVAFPFVHLARSSSVRQHLDAAAHPLQMRTILEVEHLATVMGMVANGVGITVVPALTLFHFRQPELVARPVSASGLTRKIYLVRPRGQSLSIAAQGLYDLMLECRPAAETEALVGSRR